LRLRFIVVDGLDGCGKDTHAKRIASLIEAKGERAAIVSHPSDRRFGRISKASLQSSGKVARFWATFFFIADVLVSVKGLRKQEGTVIFVRYLMGAAYLPKPLAPYGYRLFRNLLPFPDVAIFIDIEPKVAIRRIEERDHEREMFETEEKLIEVRGVAKSLLSDEWVVIDNSIDGEEPFKAVEAVLRNRSIL
jgi:dTMP kinase